MTPKVSTYGSSGATADVSSNVSDVAYSKQPNKAPKKAAKPAELKVAEKAVKAQVRNILRKLGIWYCTPLGAGFGPAAHDFICCAPCVRNGTSYGQLISIETKATNGKVRPRQIETTKAIQAHDGIVLFVYPDDVKDLEHTLNAIMRGWVPPTGA